MSTAIVACSSDAHVYVGHGRVDADEGSIIDAILGIPAYTIKMAGIHGLPHDYMMQISARGSAYKPTSTGSVGSLCCLVIAHAS